jgi:tetratricopeptide (TPR) repeat protein
LTTGGILMPAGSEWRFADELTRSVVYDSLPRQLQRELHRRAAAHAVTLGSSDPAQVAHHWLEADLPARAFTPLRRAGLQAKRAGAYGTAVSLWKTALDLLENGKLGPERTGKLRRATLHRDLAFASWRLGEPAQTIEHCYASLEGLWAGAPSTPAGWTAMLARQSVGLAWQVVRPRMAQRRRTREERARDSLRLNNGVRLIEAFYFSQGALPAAAIAVYGARIAERTGELAYGARPYGFLGYLAGSRGWHSVARFCFARPRKDCLTKRDWPSLAQSIHGETMYLLTQGRWADAIDRARFGRTLARKINKSADTGSITTLIGLGHLMAGDFAAMRAAFEQVEAIAYAKANDHYLLFAREAMGQIELVAGSPQKAESLLVQAASLAKSVRDLQSALIAEGLLANTLVRLGRPQEAAAMLPSLLERADTTPMVNFGTWYGFGAAAEAASGVYAALGEGENGTNRSHAIRAAAALARFARSYPVAEPRARLISGQIDALAGNHPSAVKHWERGLRAAEANGMRHDLARLHHALARAPGVSEEASRHHAEQAAAFTALCGVKDLPPLPTRFAPTA